MNQGIYEIISNEKIAKNVMQMIVKGDTSHLTKPGQFINIKLDGFFLRRPISVCDYGEDTITIIYKIVGHGTENMATMKPKKTKIEETVLGAYQNVENTVVSTYQKIEDTVVGTYQKIEDRFVQKFLDVDEDTHDPSKAKDKQG